MPASVKICSGARRLTDIKTIPLSSCKAIGCESLVLQSSGFAKPLHPHFPDIPKSRHEGENNLRTGLVILNANHYH
jgi:hypothetical protein